MTTPTPRDARVRIDASVCIGSSNCIEIEPDAYEMDPRGVAAVVAGGVPIEALLAGARACPVGAIEVFDETGRRIYP